MLVPEARAGASAQISAVILRFLPLPWEASIACSAELGACRARAVLVTRDSGFRPCELQGCVLLPVHQRVRTEVRADGASARGEEGRFDSPARLLLAPLALHGAAALSLALEASQGRSWIPVRTSPCSLSLPCLHGAEHSLFT